MKMGFAKTKEDLLSRSVILSSVPPSVTGEQMGKVVQQFNCVIVAKCKIESPTVTASATWLVLFQDHSMSKMFLHDRDLKCDFGEGLVHIDASMPVSCDFPNDWLDDSAQQTDIPQTSQQHYQYAQVYPNQPRGPPPPYSSGDYNAQQANPMQHPQYFHPAGMPPQNFRYPQQGGTQETGPIGYLVMPGYPYYGPSHPVMEKKQEHQEQGARIIEDQQKDFEKLQKKKADAYRNETSMCEEEEEEKKGTKMIKITKLPNGVTKDLLFNYFESRRGGGGPVEDVDLDVNSRTAIITFEESEAVERVIHKCPHLLRDKQIDVEEYSMDETEELEEITDDDNDEMQVQNIPTSTSDDTLLNYFENNRRSGGGDIKEIKFDREQGAAIITFEEESDQEQGNRIIEDQQKYLEKLQKKNADAHRNEASMCEEEGEEKKEAKMIKITKLPDGVTEDLLLNYFENIRRGGGGPVEDVDLDVNSRTAIITFEECEAVERVIQKCPHLLIEKPIDVEEYFMDEHEMQEDAPLTRIKVQNIPTSTSDDTLLNYFENNRRSGGGDIKEMKFDREQGVAIITFEEESAVQGVMKKPQKLHGCLVDVSPYIPPKPRPTYEDKLLIRGLNVNTTEECLRIFLEAKTGVAATDIVYGEERETAVVTFEDKPDFEKLQTACKKRPLEGAHLLVSKVSVSNCVIITEFSPKSSEDTLFFYFENPRHGGDIEKVDFRREDECCLIYFDDLSVVESVCNKPHIIDGHLLKVKIFHDCLGPGAGDEGHRKFKLPEPLRISDQDSNKIQFLKNSPPNKEAFEKQMSQCHAAVTWPVKQTEPLVLNCTLSKDIKGWNKLIKDWEKTVRESLLKYLDIVTVQCFSVLQELWKNVISQMGSLKMPHQDGVAVFTDKSMGNIVVCGIRPVMEKVAKQIENIIKDIEEEGERKKQRIKESTMTLKPYQFKMIMLLNLPEELEKKYKDLKVKFDKMEVLFEGVSTDIKPAQLEILLIINRIVPSKVTNMSTKQIDLMRSCQVKDYIVNKVRNDGVVGVWDTENNEVCAYGMSDNDAVKMAHLVKDSIVECPVDMEEESIPIMSSPKWQETVQQTEQNNTGLVKIYTEINELKIFILSTDDLATGVLEIVSDFLKFNTVKEMFLNYQSGIIRFLKIHNKKEMEDCERNLQTCHVKLSVTDNGIAVKGTEDGLNQAKFALNKLADQVVKRTHMLNQPGIPKFISSDKGKERLQNIERASSCIIDVSSSSDDSNDESMDEGFEILHAPSATSVPGQKVHAICSPKTWLCIYALEGDMTELKVDAIVNAANPELEHAGGLAKALVNKGGNVIQDECRDHVKRHKKLLDGAVFCSSAGKLKCQAVIHAVGPRWQGGSELEKDALETAIIRALEAAVQRNFRSIAFPALSSGVYGFPVQLCTKVIVKAIKNHLDESSSITEIYLCDVKSETVFQFREALKQVFGPDSVNVGQGTARGSVSKQKKPQSSYSYAEEDRDFSSGVGKKMSFGKIKVKVVKGAIANEQVDVIVNTTSKDLNLNSGAVSKSLLAVAGQVLEQECQQKCPGGLNPGQVVETRGGNLQCQLVVHGALLGWDPNGSSIEVLLQFMKACLKSTTMHGLSSISFPALGTGNLGYPRDVVAHQMFKCVSMFAQSNPKSTLKKVRFVVYPGDTATVKAFELEEMKLGSGAEGATGGNVGGRRNARQFSTQDSESGASYSGGNYDDNDDSQSFKVGNILLKIFSGNLLQTKVDCIINVSNRELDLTQGAVSQAILKAAGQDLMRQCSLQKKNMEKKGVAVTTAGNLSCKWIVHVAAPGGDGKSVGAWKKVVKCALKEADSLPAGRIALPLFGQSYQMAVEDSAKALTEAVFDFSQSPPSDVCEINVVIFDKRHIPAYSKSVHTTLTSCAKANRGLWQALKTTVSGLSPLAHFRSSGNEHEQRNVNYEQKEIVLTVYSNAQMNIDSAIKNIEKMCDSEVYDKVLTEDTVRELKGFQIDEIMKLQAKCQVYIEVETRLGRIRIQGIAKDVMEANDEIHTILKEVDRRKHQAAEADLMTKVVQWHCIDQTSTGPELIPYGSMVNLKIETAYKDRKTDVDFKDNKGVSYILDFSNMEEYPKQNPSDKVKVIRRDQLKDSSFEAPADWDPMGQDEHLKVVQLASSDAAYQTVAQPIMALGKTVHRIERIQNRTLYQQYAAKKKLMETNVTGQPVERQLWHGTSQDTVASINTHGFNRSYCGKNAVAYGNGVYFAVNPSYSASNTYSRVDASGIKRMYYSLVLTGEFTQGKQGMRVPPPKNPQSPHILYDCVTDNVATPGMFIIFHDTQAYPEYLVTFS